MRFKRPFERREIVLMSIIAVCLAGAAIVAAMLLTGGDGSSGQEQTEIERPNLDTTPPVDQEREKSRDQTRAKPATRAPRRPVPVPQFSADVVQKGNVPNPVNGSIGPKLNDGKLTTTDLRGTPTVLTAFNSRCAFCGPEARLLQAEWKRWAPRGVLYLGLNVRESPDLARVFTSQTGIQFPIVIDRSGQIARELELAGIPETLFISGEGRVVGRVVGGASIGQLEAGSSAARADRSAGVQQGGARVPLP
jgi:hypothetical protein